MPGRGIFIAGTDTGVGKTLVACALLRGLAALGLQAAGMKPVAAGARLRRGIRYNEDVEQLRVGQAPGVLRAAPRQREGEVVQRREISEHTAELVDEAFLRRIHYKVFAENPNRPLTRDWLLEVTAHREMEAFDRAIDLRITRLRRKIEDDPKSPRYIKTVWGGGYSFSAEVKKQ